MIFNAGQRRGESGPKLPPKGQPLSQYTWAEIDAISRAGVAAEYFLVGDTKTFTHNGTIYSLEIEDFNHDDLADGSGKAGISFGMSDCLNDTYQMNATYTNVGGYGGSQMHLTHLPAIKAGLDTELQAVIKTVNKKASAGNKSTTIVTIPCELYLRSEIEMFGALNYSVSGEGTQYLIYTTAESRIKKLNGAATNYWLRSPYKSDAGGFCGGNSIGGYGNGRADVLRGVSFGFCV